MSHPVRPVQVVLHIDELVLHGFAPADRYRIADAVQAELSRLIGERGLYQSAPRPSQLSAVRAPDCALSGREGPRLVGQRIAGAVHAALAPPSQTSGRKP